MGCGMMKGRGTRHNVVCQGFLRRTINVCMDKNGMRTYLFCACCAVCALAMMPVSTGLRASAQTVSSGPSFEVATVKPVDPSVRFDPKHFWVHVNAAGASYWSMTPVSLLAYAYDVESYQVAGPDWTNADRYDIEARFPEGTDTKDVRRMLQALLRDRFKLAFHIDQRELEGYVLVVGKRGEKLTPSVPDPASPGADAPLKPGGEECRRRDREACDDQERGWLQHDRHGETRDADGEL